MGVSWEVGVQHQADTVTPLSPLHERLRGAISPCKAFQTNIVLGDSPGPFMAFHEAGVIVHCATFLCMFLSPHPYFLPLTTPPK